jgi:hypothetical protein
MATAVTPINYRASTDPKKVAENNRLLIAQQGQGLMTDAQQRYLQEQQQRGQTADYLNQIEDPLAKGQGGYNAEEKSAIQMTPEQQQQMVTGAGISAGANTAAATDAAERAAAAAGGNPAAVAAYRARTASTVGAQAGDAQTQARIAASNAAAQREENIGQTRIGQQNQGLNYYQGQNQMANQNAQNAQQQKVQAYGVQTGGVNQAGQTAQQASQNPTTFDKTMGAVGGVLSFLEDGDVRGETAVVGENGPEAVVKPNYMDDGDMGSGEVEAEGHELPGMDGGGDSGEERPMSWLDRLRATTVQSPGQPQQGTLQRGTPASVRSWETVGKGAGMLAKTFLDDGVIEGGPEGTIFTKPTQVHLDKGEAVVPLSYRATAKARPSMAMPLVKSMQRRMYGRV